MKYAVIQCVSGNFSVASEWTDKNGAFTNFHSVCMNLYNSPDVNHAAVVVVDELFRTQKVEYIEYEEQPN